MSGDNNDVTLERRVLIVIVIAYVGPTYSANSIQTDALPTYTRKLRSNRSSYACRIGMEIRSDREAEEFMSQLVSNSFQEEWSDHSKVLCWTVKVRGR